VFAVYDCGFEARCTLEDDDASRMRMDKIYDLISESKYGIHDISRVTLDHAHRLPRFNMPWNWASGLAPSDLVISAISRNEP